MEILKTVKNNDNLFTTSISENIEELLSLIIKPKKDVSAEIKKAQEATRELNDISERIDYMIDKVIRSNKRISVSSHFDEKHVKFINSIISDYAELINYKVIKSTSIKGGVDYIIWSKS